MDKDFFQSKLFKGVILGIAAFMLLMLVFGCGVFIGGKRADFSFKWAEAYHRNFAGPRGGFFDNFMSRDFMDANGLFGQIIKVEGQTLTIKSQDNVEKIVIVKSDAAIRRQKDNLKLSDIRAGDNIVVIGEPNNDGQIEAKLIRIMPSNPKNPI